MHHPLDGILSLYSAQVIVIQITCASYALHNLHLSVIELYDSSKQISQNFCCVRRMYATLQNA